MKTGTPFKKMFSTEQGHFHAPLRRQPSRKLPEPQLKEPTQVPFSTASGVPDEKKSPLAPALPKPKP